MFPTLVFPRNYFRCRMILMVHVFLALCGLTQLQQSGVSKILRTAWYIMLCFGIATARDPNRGSPYKSIYCTDHSDCRVDLGDICYKLYEGCSQGRCMCNPGTQSRDKNGRCRNVRRGGEDCKIGDKCPDGMKCHKGTCECDVGEMTIDGDYCLRANEKLLGHACNPSADKCVRKHGSSYISEEVYCSDIGTCECKEGLEADGNSCRRRNIGDYGCVENHHCDGGSICSLRRCICPTGRMPLAGNTKCGLTGALHGLPVSEICDEIGEQSYCDHGLVCHACGDKGQSICVRSRLPPYQSPLYARQGASMLNPSHLCLLLTFIAYIMLMRR